jgi:hypothetical protein
MNIHRDVLLALLDDVELAIAQDKRTPQNVSVILQNGWWSACIAYAAIDITSVRPRVDGELNIVKNGVKQ